MKIYRTITIKSFLGVLLVTLFFTGMVVVVTEEKLSVLLNSQFIKTVFTFCVIIFYAIFGDMSFLRMNSANPGYKYFRSIPDAYTRFRRHCLSLDIAFAAVGAVLLVFAWLDGFKSTFSVITFAAYSIVFAVTHFAVAFVRFNSSAYPIIKAMLGGMIGMSSVVIGLTVSDYALISIPQTVGIIICVISAVLAAVTAIAAFSRLEKKWNED